MHSKTSMSLYWPVSLWIAFMAAASAGLSLIFACAAPLAAFGAVSGLTLSRRNALLATLGAWLANQAAGYGALCYPVTDNSLAWGAALGFSSILAMFAARWAGARCAAPFAVWAAAFSVAFIVYEAGLYIAAIVFLGGQENFSAAIVAHVCEINALSMLGMLLLNRARAYSGNPGEIRKPAPPAFATMASGSAR